MILGWLIKHYRHNNLEKATLENALLAVASLFVLLMYLHKKVFGFTQSIKNGSPDCFYTPCELDFDYSKADQYQAKQLPDYIFKHILYKLEF